MASGSGTDVSAVFDFLRRNGFVEAESVLQEEISDARGISDSFFVSEGLPTWLPPVRVAVGPCRVEGLADGNSTSSSSDAFVSMGSSINSELVNPYGVWTSSRAQTDESSSDRLSEFGTARDYNDSYWYNEIDRGFSTSWSVDKFVTNMDAQDRLRGPTAASASGGFHSATSINYLDNPARFFTRGNASLEDVQDISGSALYDTGDPPLCDCCAGVKGYYGLESGDGNSGHVRESKTSPYECYEMSDDPKSLDAPEMSKFQLNLENDVHEVLSWKQDIMRCSHQRTNSSINKQIMVSPFDDKEFRISDSFVTMESLSQTGDSKNSNSTHFKTRIDDEKFTKNANTTHLHVVKKDSQPNENAASEDGGEAIEECHDAGAVRDREGEQGSPNDLQMYENPEDEFEVFDLRIIHRKNRTGFEENKDLPVVLNTIIAGRYYVTEYLGSAAFSKVIQAHDLQTGIDVCLKIIKNDKDFFDQSLDEIKLLKFVNKHDPTDEHHILRLYDYFYHQEHLFIVCELLRANLYEFQKYNRESGGDVYFTLPRLQTITRQCLEALEYLHQLGIIHCDLKPENILMKSYSRCEIKVIDLGSSCFQSDNLCLYVQSRSYRAPEVIMGLPYDSKIDIWSLGCILAELCSGEVLFPNDSVVMLLARMIGMLGPIDMEMLIRGQETQKYFTSDYDLYHTNEESGELEYILPEKSSLAHHVQVSDFEFIKFISELLQTNPVRRPTAAEALRHPWLSHPYKLDLHEVSK